MTEKILAARESASPNLLFYWRIMWGRRRWIAGLVCVAVVGAYIQSKASPNYYISTAVVLPAPSDTKGGPGISFGGDEGGKGGKEEGGSSMSLAGLLGQGSTTTDILKSILNSRTMADALIEQLNLKAYYGTQSMEHTRGALKSETTIMVNREKAFFISVESKDPLMAASIANAYVSNLDRLHRMLNVTSVTRNRMFIERRLEEKRQQLAKAEEARKQFQEANRTLLVTDKAQAAMRAAAAIEENIVEFEVDLAAMKEYATPAHPMMNQMDAQMQALRRQLERLQEKQQAQMGLPPRGGPVSSAKGGKSFYPPMPEMAGLALDYVRLSREVKIHEVIVGMLTGQYEQARISEARDTPTVQVLDPAIPAEFKSRPRTLHNMQMAAVLALLLGSVLVLLSDYIIRLRARELSEGVAPELSQPGSLLSSLPNQERLADSHLMSDGNGSRTPTVYTERQSDQRTV